MQIGDLAGFAQYCAENSNRECFPEDIGLTEKVGSLAEKFAICYGLYGQTPSDYLDLALVASLGGDQVGVERRSLEVMREVLTKYWEHGKEAIGWFAAKREVSVIYVPDTNGHMTDAHRRAFGHDTAPIPRLNGQH